MFIRCLPGHILLIEVLNNLIIFNNKVLNLLGVKSEWVITNIITLIIKDNLNVSHFVRCFILFSSNVFAVKEHCFETL